MGRFVKVWWAKFSKALKPTWKVMKFRLPNCLWAHHPEVQPEFQKNAACIDNSAHFSKVLGELQLPQSQFQEDIQSPNSQLRSFERHWSCVPHIQMGYFGISNATEDSEALWGSIGDDQVMGARECWCGHQQTLRLPQPSPWRAGVTCCTRVGSPSSIPHTRHLQHAGNVRLMGNHLLGAWLSARGVMVACVTCLCITSQVRGDE